jgi:hypothetical protein
VEPEHPAPVEIEPQRPAVRFTRQVRHRRPFDLTQHIVYYTITWTISPRNAVPSGECGLQHRSGALFNSTAFTERLAPVSGANNVVVVPCRTLWGLPDPGRSLFIGRPGWAMHRPACRLSEHQLNHAIAQRRLVS